MTNLELVKQEKTELLNSVVSEMETRDRSIAQLQREKQSLETQALIIQGAIAMLDELIAQEQVTDPVMPDTESAE